MLLRVRDFGTTHRQQFADSSEAGKAQALVDRYDEADRERRAGKTGFAAARAGTKTALARATQALRVLDVVVPNTLVADTAPSAAWHEARRVEASAKAAPAVVTPSVPMTESRTTESTPCRRPSRTGSSAEKR
jgi:hypothetical protein